MDSKINLSTNATVQYVTKGTMQGINLETSIVAATEKVRESKGHKVTHTLVNTIGIAIWNHIDLAISLIGFGGKGIDWKRLAPLPKGTERPTAASTRRLLGARPEATNVHAGLVIANIMTIKPMMKWMNMIMWKPRWHIMHEMKDVAVREDLGVRRIGKLHMGIMNEVKIVNVNGALTAGMFTDSRK